MDLLREIIYEQNKNLLKEISKSFSLNENEEKNFIDKYNKKNFTYIRPVNKEMNDTHEKRLKRIMR